MHTRYWLMAQFVPVLILLSIWFPLIADYYVPSFTISNEVLRRSRVSPVQAVVDELSVLKFTPSVPMAGAELISAAEKLTQSYLQLPGYDPVKIGLPFDPRDLEKGLPTWQLTYSSMIAPDILLDAYRLTGKEVYFRLARDMLLAWARFERAQWLPQGFLWNDHAVAARISVLGKFWGIYRNRDDYQGAVAGIVLGMASRSGEMLAKDSQFTFATNHGVMQNLALLHLTAAFPAIPNAAAYRRIAFERLADQMRFYINAEGVVLEHSAGYHSHGMELFGKAFRYLALNDMTAPPEWIAKYRKSKDFMGMIHRPDGSLPIFGNTMGAPNPPSLVTQFDPQGKPRPLFLQDDWRPNASHALYPVAGYSVWWDNLAPAAGGAPVQTVMAWSYFPGHGHKLADEMSLLVWADRQTWLSNVGYWPYGVWGRTRADSWEGSNAPHLVNEATDSVRNTELLDYTVQGRLAFNHLRRIGPAGFSVERQVLHIGSDLWLVLDHAADKEARKTSTTWTFFPNLEVGNGALPGQFHMSRNDARSCMSAFLSGKNKLDVKMYKGSRQPFAGWVVFDSQPREAPALLVRQPSDDAWSLTVLALEKDCKERLAGPPKLTDWQTSDRWKANLPLNEGALTIQRLGKFFYINDEMYVISGPGPESANYSKEQTALERSALADAFQAAAKKYKKHKDLFNYRKNISYLLIAAFLFQEACLAFYARVTARYLVPLRTISTAVWIIGGAWLFLVYFKTY